MYYLRINFIIIFKIFIKLSTELAEICSFNNIDICHAFNSLNVSYICDCLIRIRYCNVLKKHGFSGFGVFFATDCMDYIARIVRSEAYDTSVIEASMDEESIMYLQLFPLQAEHRHFTVGYRWEAVVTESRSSVEIPQGDMIQCCQIIRYCAGNIDA